MNGYAVYYSPNIYLYNMSKIIINTIIVTAFFITGLFIPSKAQVTVISPYGGEVWQEGNPSVVSWENEGPADMFIIAFSEDNGNSWYDLMYIDGFSGVNEVLLSITSGETTQAKIRVTGVNSGGLTDESDSTFTVLEQAYNINKPIPGEIYYQSEEIYVQWYTLNSNPVNIDFSDDNGVTWTRMGSSVVSWYFSFGAPLVISEECRVRLTDATDSTFSSISGAFTIAEAPSIQLTSPNGGEVWEYGENYTITWTGVNLDNYIAIELSVDGGNNWQIYWYGESGLTGGSAEITPHLVSSNEARIRVSLYYYPQYSDVSDEVFTINSPAYIVYTPYATDAHYTGSEILIQWNASYYENTKVELSTDNGLTYQTIAPNVPAGQQYLYFTVPDQPSDSCIIRLSVVGDPTKSGISGTFRIVALPELTITFPAGGEILDNDMIYYAKWDLSGEILYSYYFNIEYSTDNGLTWTYAGFAYDLANSDSAMWRTPVETSSQCLLRLRDDYNIISAQSQSTFSVFDVPEVNICMVSVDSVSGKNIVIWDKVQSPLIDEYVILKEGNVANQYTEIGSVDQSAVSVFTDLNSDPEERASRYKLTFRDQQENIYEPRSFHQSIHLSINKGVGNNWNLIWSGYLGFAVSSYRIYRGTSTGEMTLINTVSGNFTSFTDQNAPAGIVYYMIEVINPDMCNPEGLRVSDYGSTKSNIATNKTLGFRDSAELLMLSVYPNPANDKIKISSGKSLSGTIRISVFSVYGQLVHVSEAQGSELNQGINLETSAFSPGIYSIVVAGGDNSEITKFIKN